MLIHGNNTIIVPILHAYSHKIECCYMASIQDRNHSASTKKLQAFVFVTLLQGCTDMPRHPVEFLTIITTMEQCFNVWIHILFVLIHVLNTHMSVNVIHIPAIGNTLFHRSIDGGNVQ